MTKKLKARRPGASRAPEALLAEAHEALGALAARGDARAASALEALSRPGAEAPAPRAALLARLFARQAPTGLEWSSGMADAAALDPAARDAWQLSCVSGLLSAPPDWTGTEVLRFMDEEDECDEEPFYGLAEFLSNLRCSMPLGRQTHALLHKLCVDSDFAQAASHSLDMELEGRLFELLFQAPHCELPEHAPRALGAMWESLRALSENNSIYGDVRARAASALMRAHARLGARTDGALFGSYASAFDALMEDGSDLDPLEFAPCLAQLRAEGWRLDPSVFLDLCVELAGAMDNTATRRARNLALLASDDPELLRATLRSLPLAYHINYARSRCGPGDDPQGHALDELFSLLCAQGMNPRGVWPRRDPAEASASAAIRAELERAALRAEVGAPDPEAGPLARSRSL